MEGEYRKDLSHTTWDRVYARQALRADLVADWFAALDLKPGDTVVDVGSGPGFISLLAAERVGPQGRVIAIDRSAEALDYLARMQAERGLTWIERITADAETMAPVEGRVDAALLTMMLHHTDDPGRLLRQVAGVLPAGTRVVVAEFDPEGPGEVGPPRDHRIAAGQVQQLCGAAGLAVSYVRQQTPDHYMAVAVKSAGSQ